MWIIEWKAQSKKVALFEDTCLRSLENTSLGQASHSRVTNHFHGPADLKKVASEMKRWSREHHQLGM
jgi:hypothetical protein